MEPRPLDEPMISVREAAELLGVDRKTVYKWIDAGILRAFELPADRRLIRLDRRDVAEIRNTIRP